MTKEIILILDFGSPYTQLIAQRVRENHVFSCILPYNTSAEEIKLLNPKGIILSGKPPSPDSKRMLLPDKKIFKLNIPILGVDYGMQVIVHLLGGRVKSTKLTGLQGCELFIDDTHNLFWQMPSNITCLMSYAGYIKKLPRGFKKTAHTQDNPIAAIECLSRRIFGVGFHPEVVITQRGSQILSNFLYKICHCIGSWTMKFLIREAVSSIKKTVGKGKVILNLTPALDSSVTALLVSKAIGKRLKCISIDSGLLRRDEARQVKKVFDQLLYLNLKHIDRTGRFLQNLKGITKAEEKKRIINNLFIKILLEELKKSKGVGFLAQGTLYPEVSKFAPPGDRFLKLKLLQPLKDLFQEEVKVVAKLLGIPDNIILRQPFPRSGLAIRIIGEVTAPRLRILREAQGCLVEEIKAAGIYEQIWQSFAILLPTSNVIAIRCVASTDGVTVEWVKLPYEVMEKVTQRILKKIKGISRVVYDISSQPPATIEWE